MLHMLRCFMGGLGKKITHGYFADIRGHEEIPQGLPIMVAYTPLCIANKVIFSLSGMYTCHGRCHSRSGKESSHACSRSRGTIPGTVLHEMSAISDASTRLAVLRVPFLFFPYPRKGRTCPDLPFCAGTVEGVFGFPSSTNGAYAI